MAKTPRKGDNFVTTRDQELPKGGVLIRVPKGTPGQVVTRHRDGSLYVIMAGWWWGMPGDAVEVTSHAKGGILGLPRKDLGFR